MSTSTPEMISTLVHLSHPQHPLTLSNVIEECDVTDANYATCYHCYESVRGDPTFSCTSDTKTCMCTRVVVGRMVLNVVVATNQF